MNNSRIYQLFGEASFYATILEEQLEVTCQMYEVTNNRQNYEKKNDAGKQLIKKFKKTTLGNFLRYIKEAFNNEMDEKIDLIFKPALEKRNYLVHNFFIVHREDIINNTKTEEIIDELNKIIQIIEPAAKFAQEASTNLFNVFTENIPKDTMNHIMQQATYSPNK